MELVYGFDKLDALSASVVSVGSFDGVHAGHREIMSRMNQLRDGLRETGVEAKSIVITFAPHPRHFISGVDSGFKLLNTIEEKARLVEHCGIDIMIVAEFNQQMMNTSSAQFIDMLHNKLSMRVLMAGFNHRLGNDGASSSANLKDLTHSYDVELETMPEFFVERLKVSSTVVRRVVSDGDMALAERLLSHKYFAVVEKKAEENLKFFVPTQKLLPRLGEYAVRIKDLDGKLLINNTFVHINEHGEISLIDSSLPSNMPLREKYVLEFL